MVSRKTDSENRFTEYFMGLRGMKVKSALKSIRFQDLRLYRVTRNDSMTSALPAHFNQEDIKELRVVKIEPAEVNLTKAVLGILHYSSESGGSPVLGQLVQAPLAYYAYVDEVNMDKQTVDILIPNSLVSDQQLMSAYSILSQMSWIK